jgi:O-antigen/teichoic acid export membrane protein
MLILSSALSGSIDKLIIVPILGLGVLGNYQLGIQFLTVLQILPSIVYKYILPHDASGNPNKKLKKAMVIASIAFTIMGILLSPLVVPALFPKFTDTVQVIQIISLSLIPDSIITIYQSKYFGSERSRLVLIGSAIYVAVQIITIIILGKIFGINGVAASLVLSSLATCIFYLAINRFFETKGRTVLS